MLPKNLFERACHNRGRVPLNIFYVERINIVFFTPGSWRCLEIKGKVLYGISRMRNKHGIR